MSDTLSQLAEELADSLTVSASGVYSLSGQTTVPNDVYTVNNAGISASSYPYTITGSPYSNITIGAGTGISSPWATTTTSKINLDGADADIEINGISLLKTMQEIQSRLNILQPNTALEAEWNELYELGRKYRELEQQIKEKQATWDKLKAMPPPEIN